MNLNPAQKEVVDHLDGPILVLAGAGSWKTHTLTERVKFLVNERGIHPESILCVTFTNKAAREMKERIMGKEFSSRWGNYMMRDIPFISTFHSLWVFFLRRFIDKIGYDKNFVIYDETDKFGFMKQTIKRLKYEEKEVPARKVIAEISRSKNAGVSAAAYSSTVDSYFTDCVSNIYLEYEKGLKENNALDFDDILLKTLDILQIEEVREYFWGRFQYFMVDEYQDTNDTQYQIVKILASRTKNLCVVGDDWQGIYSWRWANISNILSFQKDYQDAKIIRLEQNYRSTKNIILAANEVIKNNTSALKKELWTDNPEGEKIGIHEAYDDRKEADLVIGKIADYEEDGWDKSAILYRTNSQSRGLEEALIRSNIPYRVYGGVKFYDRKEIKDILSVIRLFVNPYDSVAFSRILGFMVKGVGVASIAKIIAFVSVNHTNFLSLGKNLDEFTFLRESGRESLSLLYKIFENIAAVSRDASISIFMKTIVEGMEYEKYLDKNFDESEVEVRMENISEFLNLATRYDHLESELSRNQFLEDIALLTDADTNMNGDNTVSLMTIHTAKWLEFEHVFLTGLEENIFPHSRSIIDAVWMEEERRLMYVAMTRAKKTLDIYHARTRYSFGDYSSQMPSRFLKEIPEIYTEIQEEKIKNSYFSFGNSSLSHPEPVRAAPTRTYNDPNSFFIGQKISHRSFGTGTIVELKGEIATISFPSKWVRKMNVKLAPIEGV